MAICNPYERIDSLTGAFNSRYFDCWLEELYANKREFHVINVDIANHKKINLVFGNKATNLRLRPSIAISPAL